MLEGIIRYIGYKKDSLRNLQVDYASLRKLSSGVAIPKIDNFLFNDVANHSHKVEVLAVVAQ